MLHFASEGQEKNEKSPEDTYRHSDRFMNGFQAKGIFYVSAWSYIYIYIFFFLIHIYLNHIPISPIPVAVTSPWTCSLVLYFFPLIDHTPLPP